VILGLHGAVLWGGFALSGKRNDWKDKPLFWSNPHFPQLSTGLSTKKGVPAGGLLVKMWIMWIRMMLKGI
jgi:hypothetical protein